MRRGDDGMFVKAVQMGSHNTRTSMTRDEFLTIRNAFLTSAQPIQSPEHLKGRTRALQALQDSLTSPGRHAFIYGYRGVGKSSLAQTTAFQLQHSTGTPILVACEPTSTFAQICADIVRLSLIPTRTNTDSSCSVMCRASTSRNASQIKDVHGRDNLGYAAAGGSRTTLFGISVSPLGHLEL